MLNQNALERLSLRASNRRRFVRGLGIASGALAGSELIRAQSSTPTDIDILNFALNLEYLDAEFYNITSSGNSLDALGVDISGSGTVGGSTGVQKLTFPNAQTQRLAEELAHDELAQVVLIRSTILNLGGTPIARPAMDYTAARLDLTDPVNYAKLARIFEDTAITAYCGSAASITDKNVLTATSRILAIEAEHVGAIRFLLYTLGADPSTPPPLDAADVPLPPGGHIFSVNDRGLAEIRTPAQVLFAAFGGAPSATKGGFFPNGVNGSITTSSATAAPYEGSSLTANPNPVPRASGNYGQTTITWNASGATQIEIHVDDPDGPVFLGGPATGSAQTGVWVGDGTTFYLKDASHGPQRGVASVLATLTVGLQS